MELKHGMSSKISYKPKVGDRVIITKSNYNWNSQGDHRPSMNTWIGRIITITSTDGNQIHFDGDGGWHWQYSQHHFEPLDDSNIENYKP